jgi:hypothetical protein
LVVALEVEAHHTFANSEIRQTQANADDLFGSRFKEIEVTAWIVGFVVFDKDKIVASANSCVFAIDFNASDVALERFHGTDSHKESVFGENSHAISRYKSFGFDFALGLGAVTSHRIGVCGPTG